MDFVIVINVHENAPFLMKQLKNIQDHVSNYIVILNCNQYMFHELKNANLPNVVINPVTIEKNRFHGSLTHGIYSNLMFAQQYDFAYFIALSSRNLFYQRLSKKDIDNLLPMDHSDNDPEKNEWFWPSFKKTKLAKYYNNINLRSNPHEGLVFDSYTCKQIIQFLENHKDIKEDLFQFPTCVEEFALSTIAFHQGNGYYDIGHGTETQYTIPTDPKKYVYKTLRI
jgi:hypothetical protein